MKPLRRGIAAVAKRLQPGQVALAFDGGRDVAVARNQLGDYFVVDDLCPHDGGRLSDGYIEGNRIICSRHNWEFDLATGQCPYHPARSITVCAWPSSPLLAQITKPKQ
jgi:nitrite reductase/ring-hydroxylating ferredoxin subunit